MQKQTFSSVRKSLMTLDRDGLVAILGDLYSLSSQNRDFLVARFIPSAPSLDKYKKTIRKSLYPNVMGSGRIKISFRDAKKAVSDYKKAIGAGIGLAELIVYAVECGNDFTCEYGDIDEPFYDSMARLFELATKEVKNLKPEDAAPFIVRLGVVVDRADCIGWGYHDSISATFADAFADL
jgi:hypothetical protein